MTITDIDSQQHNAILIKRAGRATYMPLGVGASYAALSDGE